MIYEKKDVPIVVIKRLPRYYRYLGELLEHDITRISSSDLSKRMGVTASQIRQDFNCFGGFGQQGYGYNIQRLHDEIADILGLSKGYRTIIVGAGNLGHALANHANFKKRGFKLVGIFDINPDVVGTKINGVEVMHIDSLGKFMSEKGAEIAMLALPKEAVHEVAHRLALLKIKGLWNFSYADIEVPENVAVENVHLSDSLMTLSYKITSKEKDTKSRR